MGYYTERCQSYVEPQDIEMKTDYCLTINPLRTFVNPLDFKRQMGQYLQDNLFCPYHFYVERSAKGKFHVHGTVSFQSYDSINQFYDFLQKMDEEKIMSYKFGDMFTTGEDDMEAEINEEVIPGVEQKTVMTWEQYCSKQEKYWEAQEFKSKFTHKYNPGVNCVFNAKPKKSRAKNPKKKATNEEIQEMVDQIQIDKDTVTI